jgi:Raf kinase inhibitor-like YbhB/YbcL family protein
MTILFLHGWHSIPGGVKPTYLIALICDDPDAPLGTWVHWVLFNLPTQSRELDEGVPTTETLPSGAKHGKNDFGKIGYCGPAPPKGKAHRYFFKLYALGWPWTWLLGRPRPNWRTLLRGTSWPKDNSWGLTSDRQQPSAGIINSSCPEKPSASGWLSACRAGSMWVQSLGSRCKLTGPARTPDSTMASCW